MPEKRVNKSKAELAQQKRAIYEKYLKINSGFDIETVIKPGKTIQHIDDNDEKYKFCSNCESWVEFDKFPSNLSNWDEKERYCKTCKNKQTSVTTKIWKENNKEHVEEYRKEYEKAHQDQRKEYNKLTNDEQIDHDLAHKKTYYKEFNTLANSQNGFILSHWTEYVDAHTKLWIECEKAHSFEITLSNLKLGKWCPACNGKQSKKCSSCKKTMTVDNFNNKIVRDKESYQDKCRTCSNEASSQYKKDNADKVSDYNKKYREEHPEQIQSYYKKTDEEKEETQNARITKYYDKFRQLIEQKGGKCLSEKDDYATAHTKLKAQCQDGHEFEICLNNLSKDRWCSHCNIFYGEEYSRFIMNYFFDCKFEKKRPEWLKNVKGNKLELDGYNLDKKLAFEYNGLQHYEEIPYFYKTKEDFEKRLADDKIKLEKCKEKDINLIIIPYDVNINDLPKYIFDKCKECGLEIEQSKLDEFNQTTYNQCINQLEKVKQQIEEKEGELIEGQYVSRDSKLIVRCHKNHEFTTCPKNITRGLWCPKCGFEVEDKVKTKISFSMTEFFNTEKGKDSKTNALVKRSETMAKEKEEARANLVTKKCGTCGEVKNKDDFGNKTDAKDGKQTNCKFCVNMLKRQNRAKNNAIADDT